MANWVPAHLGDLLADHSVRTVVCCGSGGVGKTTVAAAVAVAAAESGRRVVVLTIDPARRLAQALGLPELNNEPGPVTTIDSVAGGSLDAMMLDMKRTFDEVVLRHVEGAQAQTIFANPVYQTVSNSFAGTQEYMAMERLGQLLDELDESGDPRWDLVVVDTPPARSALDFLDAPQRLGTLLDGRVFQVLTAPARLGGSMGRKVMTFGLDVVGAVLARIIGPSLVQDAQVFFSAIDGMLRSFRVRAEATYAKLTDPSTAFLVVASPNRDAVREAYYFVDRLAAEQLPLAALVMNQVITTPPGGISEGFARELARSLRDAGNNNSQTDWSSADTVTLLEAYAQQCERAAHDEALLEQLAGSYVALPVAVVQRTQEPVGSLPHLRKIAHQLLR